MDYRLNSNGTPIDPRLRECFGLGGRLIITQDDRPRVLIGTLPPAPGPAPARVAPPAPPAPPSKPATCFAGAHGVNAFTDWQDSAALRQHWIDSIDKRVRRRESAALQAYIGFVESMSNRGLPYAVRVFD